MSATPKKKIIKKKKNTNKPVVDASKDKVIRALMSVCREQGLEVRREKLKQGSGWRALSGACMHAEKKILFVDSRLPQDEQIDFLIVKARDFKINFSEENIANFPERVRAKLAA